MTTRVNIPYTQVMLALDRWDDVCGKQTVSYLTEFLGSKRRMDTYYVVNLDSWLVPPKVAQRINLLLSPHWYAIIKAWLALKGYVDESKETIGRDGRSNLF